MTQNERPMDVLRLSETWLDHSIHDSEIILLRFVCVRKERIGVKEGNGGVFFTLGFACLFV